MDLQQAQQVIREKGRSFADLIEAASVINSDQRSTLEDLLACLKLGGEPAFYAQVALEMRSTQLKSTPDVIESARKKAI